MKDYDKILKEYSSARLSFKNVLEGRQTASQILEQEILDKQILKDSVLDRLNYEKSLKVIDVNDNKEEDLNIEEKDKKEIKKQKDLDFIKIGDDRTENNSVKFSFSNANIGTIKQNKIKKGQRYVSLLSLPYKAITIRILEDEKPNKYDEIIVNTIRTNKNYEILLSEIVNDADFEIITETLAGYNYKDRILQVEFLEAILEASLIMGDGLTKDIVKELTLLIGSIKSGNGNIEIRKRVNFILKNLL